jgi:hypothetical protein
MTGARGRRRRNEGSKEGRRQRKRRGNQISTDTGRNSQREGNVCRMLHPARSAAQGPDSSRCVHEREDFEEASEDCNFTLMTSLTKSAGRTTVCPPAVPTNRLLQVSSSLASLWLERVALIPFWASSQPDKSESKSESVLLS